MERSSRESSNSAQAFKWRYWLSIFNLFNTETQVAVKTSTRSTCEDIDREVRVFQKLSQRHLNIVNLMGVILHTEEGLHPYLLLELCEVSAKIAKFTNFQGNLEKYMQKHKEDFIAGEVRKSKVLSEFGDFSSKYLVKCSYQV